MTRRKTLWLPALMVLAWAAAACPPAQAYYAPVQPATGPTVYTKDINGVLNTCVDFSVHNPVTGQDDTHTYTAGPAGTYPGNRPTNNQGIVGVDFYTYGTFAQHRVVWAVYDPGPGRGWMINEYSVYDTESSLLNISDGVVYWYYWQSNPMDPWFLRTYTIVVSTYDPAKGQWVDDSWSFFEAEPLNRITHDGVAAFTVHDDPHCAVYDPTNGGAWRIHQDAEPNYVKQLQIFSGTLEVTEVPANSLRSHRAYDFASQTWQIGDTTLYTTPYAGFVAQPTSGAAPLTVWFTEMTLGKGHNAPDHTDWEYDFGDGSPPVNAFSTYHTYTSPGTYTASFRVSGDGVEDIRTVQVEVQGKVQGKPLTALPLLLD